LDEEQIVFVILGQEQTQRTRLHAVKITGSIRPVQYVKCLSRSPAGCRSLRCSFDEWREGGSPSQRGQSVDGPTITTAGGKKGRAVRVQSRPADLTYGQREISLEGGGPQTPPRARIGSDAGSGVGTIRAI
jgi:hypothetical protein